MYNPGSQWGTHFQSLKKARKKTNKSLGHLKNEKKKKRKRSRRKGLFSLLTEIRKTKKINTTFPAKGPTD